jgi:peroxiredoxin
MKLFPHAAAIGFAALALLAANGTHAATIGKPAPTFSATDLAGKPVSLADFKGRTVVLEWVNPGCPYVQKHYDSANMQGTQTEAVAKGVVWLAINSTAPEHHDYKAPAAMASWMSGHKAAATATLLDPDGKIGRAYGARTTPHMFVIDARGTLVYAGAIDSKPSSSIGDIATATNHVKAALADTLAGKPVSVAQTRAYGCSVKYSSGA